MTTQTADTETVLELVEAAAEERDDDDLYHLYCPCDPDIAYCGTDISRAVEKWLDDTDLQCRVCFDLVDAKVVCSRCGRIA